MVSSDSAFLEVAIAILMPLSCNSCSVWATSGKSRTLSTAYSLKNFLYLSVASTACESERLPSLARARRSFMPIVLRISSSSGTGSPISVKVLLIVSTMTVAVSAKVPSKSKIMLVIGFIFHKFT